MMNTLNEFERLFITLKEVYYECEQFLRNHTQTDIKIPPWKIDDYFPQNDHDEHLNDIIKLFGHYEKLDQIFRDRN